MEVVTRRSQLCTQFQESQSEDRFSLQKHHTSCFIFLKKLKFSKSILLFGLFSLKLISKKCDNQSAITSPVFYLVSNLLFCYVGMGHSSQCRLPTLFQSVFSLIAFPTSELSTLTLSLSAYHHITIGVCIAYVCQGE